MDFGFQLAKVAFSLTMVLGMLALTAYGLKRFGRWTKHSDGNSWIEIVGRQPIGMKHQLLLVRVRGQLLFLGVSPQGISLLSPVDGEVSSPPSNERI